MKTSAPVLLLLALLTLHGALRPPACAAAPQSQQPDGDKAETKFEGLQKVSEVDLRQTLREHAAALKREDAYDPVKLGKAVGVIKDYLAARGYLGATVKIRRSRATASAKAVTFVVNEGERARVAEIRFEGNKVFGGLQLLDSLKADPKDPEDLCMMPKGYDADVLNFCLRRVQFFMRRKGYLQAKLGEPKRELTERGVELVVPVIEGALYRFGGVTFEGATVFTSEQLLGMLELKKGDAADGDVIGKWLQETLKTAYGNLGYVMYEYDVEPTFRDGPDGVGDGVAEFLVTITEGNRFVIRKINFAGPKTMSEEDLRRLLLIHEGEPYDGRKLTESLRNLYQLGLTEWNGDRIVDYRTNEAEGLLDLTIGLKGYKWGARAASTRPAVKRRAASSN